MKRLVTVLVVAAVVMPALCFYAYAGSDKTWSGIGKGLAIYEGVKVLTGREGNIVDDVTGGMKPRGSSTAASAGGAENSYNSGYKQGYEAGYNAGFRAGIEHSAGQ